MSLFGTFNAETIDETFGIPDGERDLTITDANDTISQKGNHGLVLELTDDETKETLETWQNIPDSGDPDKDATSAKWLKRLFKSLEIPEERMSEVEPEDLIGIEITATVYTQVSGQYENKRVRNIHVRRGSSMTSTIGESTGHSGSGSSDAPSF